VGQGHHTQGGSTVPSGERALIVIGIDMFIIDKTRWGDSILL
jgi:hypothetical protein